MNKNNKDDFKEVTELFKMFFKFGPIAFIVILLVCAIINLVLHPNTDSVSVIFFCSISLLIVIPLGYAIGIFGRK